MFGSSARWRALFPFVLLVVLFGSGLWNHCQMLRMEKSLDRLKTQLRSVESFHQEVSKNLESVVPPIEDLHKAIVRVDSRTRETTSVLGCFVTTQGQVLTIAKGVETVGTTCTVISASLNSTGTENHVYRVAWSRPEHNLALLLPEQPLPRPVLAMDFSTTTPARGDAVAVAGLAVRNMSSVDSRSLIPAAHGLYHTEIPMHVMAVLPGNDCLVLDRGIDIHMLGAAVVDRTSKLAALAFQRIVPTVNYEMPTTLAVPLGADLRSIIRENELSWMVSPKFESLGQRLPK